MKFSKDIQTLQNLSPFASVYQEIFENIFRRHINSIAPQINWCVPKKLAMKIASKKHFG